MVKEFSQDVVDHVLKCGGSIGKAEGHDLGFKMTVACSKSCLPFVPFFDADEVIAISEVQFCEELGSLYPVC